MIAISRDDSWMIFAAIESSEKKIGAEEIVDPSKCNSETTLVLFLKKHSYLDYICIEE